MQKKNEVERLSGGGSGSLLTFSSLQPSKTRFSTDANTAFSLLVGCKANNNVTYKYKKALGSLHTTDNRKIEKRSNSLARRSQREKKPVFVPSACASQAKRGFRSLSLSLYRSRIIAHCFFVEACLRDFFMFLLSIDRREREEKQRKKKERGEGKKGARRPFEDLSSVLPFSFSALSLSLSSRALLLVDSDELGESLSSSPARKRSSLFFWTFLREREKKNKSEFFCFSFSSSDREKE